MNISKIKVIKTTFEQEQKDKDEAWLKLTPFERLDRARTVRQRMKEVGKSYSFKGLKVKVSKLL